MVKECKRGVYYPNTVKRSLPPREAHKWEREVYMKKQGPQKPGRKVLLCEEAASGSDETITSQ